MILITKGERYLPLSLLSIMGGCKKIAIYKPGSGPSLYLETA
jgi:hypothetical protein